MKPVFKKHPVLDYQLMIGSSAVLSCEAEGEATYSWQAFVDREWWEAGTESSLRIYPTESMTYRCVLKLGDEQTASRNIAVRVCAKPKADVVLVVSPGDSFTLPMGLAPFKIDIDWGDDCVEFGVTEHERLTHSYSEPGIRVVSYSGSAPHLQFYPDENALKLLLIPKLDFDSVGQREGHRAFRWCAKLQAKPSMERCTLVTGQDSMFPEGMD